MHQPGGEVGGEYAKEGGRHHRAEFFEVKMHNQEIKVHSHQHDANAYANAFLCPLSCAQK